jgi:tetratricopeptide (TPR) repeat protein
MDPENLEIKLTLAQILFKKKHIHEAIFVLLRCYDKYSDDVQVNYKLAAYHAYLHKMFEAQLYFQKALNLNYKVSVMIFKQFPKTRSIQAFQTLASQYPHHTQN